MADREADTVVILSSELISKITEEYFNKTMFKQRVTIVDLKPAESGYVFSVVFSAKVEKALPVESIPQWEIASTKGAVNGVRDSKGKFVKVGVKG